MVDDSDKGLGKTPLLSGKAPEKPNSTHPAISERFAKVDESIFETAKEPSPSDSEPTIEESKPDTVKDAKNHKQEPPADIPVISPAEPEVQGLLNRIKILSRSIPTSIISALIVAIFGPTMIAAGKFLKQPRSNKVASWIHQHTWSIPTLKMANIRLVVEGLENLNKDSAHILASNHQGLLDNLAIPAALAQKGLGMSFVAKRELLKVPIFGKAIESLGVPAIDRGKGEEAKQLLNSITEMIQKNKLNVIWYPEGTRSKDGKIGPFKKGFAYMAVAAGAPVVPVSISGSNECMPKGSNFAKPGTITVTFGSPIRTDNLSIDNKEDINRLVELTKQAIIEMGNHSTSS